MMKNLKTYKELFEKIKSPFTWDDYDIFQELTEKEKEETFNNLPKITDTNFGKFVSELKDIVKAKRYEFDVVEDDTRYESVWISFKLEEYDGNEFTINLYNDSFGVYRYEKYHGKYHGGEKLDSFPLDYDYDFITEYSFGDETEFPFCTFTLTPTKVKEIKELVGKYKDNLREIEIITDNGDFENLDELHKYVIEKQAKKFKI